MDTQFIKIKVTKIIGASATVSEFTIPIDSIAGFKGSSTVILKSTYKRELGIGDNDRIQLIKPTTFEI